MFNKNLEYLVDEKLKARLQAISIEDSRKSISYCITPSNDYVILKNDVPLDDIENPRKAAKDMLSQNIKKPMKANDIIINFGIGLGYLLDETFNTHPSRIMIYEPDIKILHFVLNNVDISEHLASGRVTIFTDLDELIKKLSSMYLTKDKVEIVYLKNYAIIKNQELITLTQKVYDTCKSKMIDINTITKFSKNWLENSIKNIAKVNNSATYLLSDLVNKFEGQTALIVAAGPSLNENIEKIKSNREKFVIFAVNKVLRTLLSNDIIPDFLVCLDAANTDYTLVGLEDYLPKINCIMDLKSDNNILNKNFRRCFISFSENDFAIRNLMEYNRFIKTLEIGGSATTMAYVSAVVLGFSKIIFTGLDLAFKDDVIYSSGETIQKLSDSQIAIDRTTKNIVYVDSVNGGKVATRDDYAAFIKHFELLINETDYKEVYNTTSFGAKINGIKNYSFDEISLIFTLNNSSSVLGETRPFKFEIKEWLQDELFLINNIINILSMNDFSLALVSAIVKSPLTYQYMQADVLNVIQSNFDPALGNDFLDKTKVAVRTIVDLLQKNRLI